MTRYRVYRKTAGSGWKTLKNVTTTSCTDTTAIAGTTYTYTVRCLSNDGTTLISSYDTKGISATITPAPKLVSATASSSAITVVWNAVPGATRYRLYRKTASTNWTALKNTTATSYTDKTAAAGTTYTYTVRCLSDDGTTLISSYDTEGVTGTRK